MKANQYKIGIIFWIVVANIAMVSCKKINELPVNNLVVENTITNEATAKVALNGIYSYFGTYGDLDAYTITDNGLRSNLLEVSTQRSTYEMELKALQVQESWVYLKNLWQVLFKIINASNNFIYQLDKLSNEKLSSDKKNKLLGEAYFMRGYANLYQLKMFCHFWDINSEYGPLLRLEPAGLNNNFKARDNVKEGYSQILQDLRFAEANAPNFYSVYKSSNSLAKAYLVETLLLRGEPGDYTEAANLADNVITTSGFTLQSTFAGIFSTTYQSTELMFSRAINKTVEEDFINNVPSIYSLLGKKRNAPTSTYFGFINSSDPRYASIIGTTTSRNAQGVTTTFTNSWLKHWRIDGNVPMRFMRLTQMYLYKAEALYRSGASVASVLAPLNTLRSRSGLPVYTTAMINNPSDLSDIIFSDFIVEVGVDNGSDFFAAVRFKNILGERKIKDVNPAYSSDKQLALPIPDAELIFNPLMKQNPQ